MKIRGAALSLMAATCALAGAGCKKDTQSLVVAKLKLDAPDPRAADVMSVSLTAMPGPTRSYQLKKMLATDTTVDLGIYIPGDITGQVTIIAVATPPTGCVGFRGMGNTQIASAGDTASVTIALSVDNVCPNDAGGTGGGGGSAGSGGSGGSSAGAGGTGGATGGSGGSAGSTAGAGGSTTGGAGGSTAGRGGGGGTAGAGGSGAGGGKGGSTAGSGGGGAGGSGGSTAGRGGNGGSTAGSGGGGATGAGGMAGYPAINNCRSFPHGALTGCPNTTVRAVAVSPNGQLVATAGDDYRLKIWNFNGQTLTAAGPVFDTNGGIHGVAFSPDGTRLAFTDGATVRTYTVAGWTAGPTLLGDGSNNDLVGVGFTPDSQRVVSADAIGSAGGDVFVHNVGGSTLPALMAHVARQPASLAVAPKAASNGTVGIVVGTYNATIAVLALGASALPAPTVLSASPDAGAVYAVTFSADGSLVAAGDDAGVVQFWPYPLAGTTPTGNNLSFAGGDVINAVAFSPSGTYLAVGGGFFSKQLSIYTATTRMEIDRTTPADDIASAVFSPSGGAMIAGEDNCGTVLVCN